MRSAVKCGPGSWTSRLTSWSKSQVSERRLLGLLFFMQDKNQNPTSHPLWYLTQQIVATLFSSSMSTWLSFVLFGVFISVETVERENNKDYNQVLLDVQRSLRRFPPGKRSSCFGPVCSTRCIDRWIKRNQAAVLYDAVKTLWLLPVLWLTCTGMPDEQREGLQEELIDIILRVLKRNPQLHYYQGYHDIVVTFLLVVKERYATALVEKLSTHHLRYLDVNLNSKPFFTLHPFILWLFVCQHALVSSKNAVFMIITLGTSWIRRWTTQNTFLTTWCPSLSGSTPKFMTSCNSKTSCWLSYLSKIIILFLLFCEIWNQNSYWNS